MSKWERNELIKTTFENKKESRTRLNILRHRQTIHAPIDKTSSDRLCTVDYTRPDRHWHALSININYHNNTNLPGNDIYYCWDLRLDLRKALRRLDIFGFNMLGYIDNSWAVVLNLPHTSSPPPPMHHHPCPNPCTARLARQEKKSNPR